jgi:hypothetical protein
MSLSGPLPTKSGSLEIKKLIKALALRTREPVRIVLSATDLAGFREFWLGELSHVPERHREIRLRMRRHVSGHRDDDQLELFGDSQ